MTKVQFNLYYKNFNWLLIGLIIITAVVFGYVLYDRFKLNGRPVSSTVFLGLLLILLFYLVNFGQNRFVRTPITYLDLAKSLRLIMWVFWAQDGGLARLRAISFL